MKAMILERVASLSDQPMPLRLVDLPRPTPTDDELLVRVSVCGVCHTELDEIEGRLEPPRLPIVLGHQVVGQVESHGQSVTAFKAGQRVGIGWIHHSCGGDRENLSPEFTATGFHVHGGYAEYITVPQNYAVAIPDNLSDPQAAPLLCAGAIGYRSFQLTNLCDGEPLGLMGFGGSAHLVLQISKFLCPRSPVFVFHRSESVRQFARKLGADWAGNLDDSPPDPPQAIIDTTPAWRPVIESMSHLRPGGRLVINAIRKEDADKEALLRLSYHDHLWMEREIKSVANLTHRDIAEFLPLAGRIPIKPKVTQMPLEQANQALMSLRRGGIQGANVLTIRTSKRGQPEL